MRATVAYAMNRSNRTPISAKGSCLARSEMTAERNLFTESRVEAENDVREDSLACRFKRLMRETSSLLRIRRSLECSFAQRGACSQAKVNRPKHLWSAFAHNEGRHHR